MTISFSATNPCHMFPLAREVARLGALSTYYSGYPKWKLGAPGGMRVRTHSWRTNFVYGAMKFLPARALPDMRKLYAWQDAGFDRWVGRHLAPSDFIHGMPGQCVHTFKQARTLGIRTVLNHATGPVREWVRIMEPEYARIGLKIADVTPYDSEYFEREDEEYVLADFHCAASTIVRDQLLKFGIAPEKIWLVPYGADAEIFHPPTEPRPSGFRIVFAGMLGLRKGLRALLTALELSKRSDWQLDVYGAVLPESRLDLDRYRGAPKLQFHGPVSQAHLAAGFRRASVLVLPSLEEGFGLVVPQALSTGLPCIVSDRVGAKDLIEHHRNGSIVPAETPGPLVAELTWWEQNGRCEPELHDWHRCAETLVAASRRAVQ